MSFPHQIFDSVKSVLIVEDNDDDYLMLVKELTREARTYRFTRASTLKAALDILQAQEFDSILLDLGLPDSQGFDTYNSISEVNLHRTPVLIRTQYVESVPQAVLRGSDDTEVVGKGDGTDASTAESTDKIVAFLEKSRSVQKTPRARRDKLDGREVSEVLASYYEMSRAEWENSIGLLKHLYDFKVQFVRLFWKAVLFLAITGLLGLSIMGAIKEFLDKAT